MRFLSLSAAAVILLAAGCAQRNAAGGAGAAPDNTGTPLPVPTSLPSSGLPPAMRPNQAQPDPRAAHLKPVPWTSAVPTGERQVQVSYAITGNPACSTLGRVHVLETARSVKITVFLGRLPGTDCTGPQSQLAATMITAVTLAAPVGDRTILDGARG